MANKMNDFKEIWQTYIMPLKNKKVYTVSQHLENTITNVTWEHLERLSSKKNASKIPFYVFMSCYAHVCEHGMLTKQEIHHLYAEKFRASSIIFAILAEIPLFDIIPTSKATETLVWNKESKL